MAARIKAEFGIKSDKQVLKAAIELVKIKHLKELVQTLNKKK